MDSHIRGRFTLKDVSETKPGRLQFTFDIAIEIQGVERPALVGEYLVLWIKGSDQHDRRHSAAPALKRLSQYYADCAPEREAVVLGDLRLAFREFAKQIDQCAKGIVSSGVSQGDRVATLSNPHPRL